MLRYLLLIWLCMLPFIGLLSQQNPSAPATSHTPNGPFSLDELQRRNFLFFWELANPVNFQIPDRYPRVDFSSVASTGFGLSAYLVGAERGWITRAQAAERVLKTLEVLKKLPQGPQPSGVAGYKGWFYHFLDNQTALRFKNVELSSIDTGLLMAGVLSCMSYFDHDEPVEKAIRENADFLFRRVEFDWYMNEHHRLSMGWFPERGFLPADWRGYNEAMLLVVMAMGSPTHPIPANAWESWCKPYFRATFKGQDMVNFGPLFGHQYSQCWIDFKGIQDPYMKKMGIDYFENSRRATLANRQYCIDNPLKFKGYGENVWGLTAGDGPDAEMEHNGQRFFAPGYDARGVAIDYQEDDGTIAPTAALASMPFAPEYVLPLAEHLWNRWPVGPYGFFDGYNETFTDLSRSPNAQKGYPFWVDRDYLGIDQGPIVLMIENYRTGLIWNLLKKNPYIVQGLKRAGFKGGWIDSPEAANALKGVVFADGQKARPNKDVPVEPNSFFKRLTYDGAEGQQLLYQLMEPVKKTAGQKYPLVIFLHGSGERGTGNNEQMRNGVHAFCEKNTLKNHPCYLLVPQCPPEEVWGGVSRDWEKVAFNDSTYSPSGKMVIELIDKMLRENPNIDRKRIYITGLSMGGFGTYDLMMRRPDLFAAGLPVCGGADPAFAYKIKNIPIWAFHGRLDDAVYPKYDWQIVEALKKAGSPIKYTEYSTFGHNIWDITYYNPAVLEWLFAQRKK
ncbi:MAG: prolyl oligopeptidase family serine peptidase [Bacteroidetes bacterium]|nr:prolyl oligopeptidase family serine peptidase [Bacteroidota bacterium]